MRDLKTVLKELIAHRIKMRKIYYEESKVVNIGKEMKMDYKISSESMDREVKILKETLKKLMDRNIKPSKLTNK